MTGFWALLAFYCDIFVFFTTIFKITQLLPQGVACVAMQLQDAARCCSVLVIIGKTLVPLVVLSVCIFLLCFWFSFILNVFVPYQILSCLILPVITFPPHLKPAPCCDLLSFPVYIKFMCSTLFVSSMDHVLSSWQVFVCFICLPFSGYLPVCWISA